MQNLKGKAVTGVSWSMIDTIANSGVTFFIGLVLARILTPVEFGLIGMITVFIALSNSIIDSGFSSALIRKGNATNTDYNTVFYFNFVFGLVLYSLLYLFAPYIGGFFNEPQLVEITRVLGLVLVINSFGIVQRTILVKAIDFKTQTKVSLIASISSGIVGVSMALLDYGVWSLVSQQLTRQLLNSVLLWVFNRWSPQVEFSYKSFKELFGFGSKLMLSGIIDTIYGNLFFIIIGKYYSANDLGQYTRADQFRAIFSVTISSVVQKVSYPVLCSIQDDDVRLKKTYQRIIKSTMMLTFTCMLGLVAVAKPLVLILIGVKWLESVYFLQIICFSGMLYPLHAINLNMLQVKGRSDLFLRLEIIKKVIGIIPILLGVFYGIEWMLFSNVFISFVAYLLNSYYSSNLLNYGICEQLKDIFPTFSLSMLGSIALWSLTLFGFSSGLTLLMQISLGAGMYFLIFEFFQLSEYLELKEIVLSLYKKNK
jgi:teichuronic acid exporter